MKKQQVHCPVYEGFTLVEVMVALALFVVAITAFMGVIPSGMKQVQTSTNESRGMALMESLRDDVKLALATGMTSSQRYELEIPDVGSGSSEFELEVGEDGEVTSDSLQALYRVKVRLERPPVGVAQPIHLHLRTTWPVAAPEGRESGAVELVAAFAP